MAEREAKDENSAGTQDAARLARELERERKLEQRERSQLIRVGRAIRLADFMAILMVLATGFSAYATWRTAQVTRTVFAVTDRPFLGVISVKFEATDTSEPRITIAYQNFGRVPALDSLVSVHAVVDGKRIPNPPDEMSTIDTGILSPGVEHYFYNYVPLDTYKRVAAGIARMQVHVNMRYTGPAQKTQFCYFERIVYSAHSATFRLGGGSDKCGGREVF